MTETDPQALTQSLIDLLNIEQLDTDLYRGARQPGGVGRVFGGQVIAQALQAAQRSTPDKPAHSLHAYFMRPGDEDFPIIYRVVRDFEGRSFATRRVVAMQKGQPILNMAASFQAPEEGLHHQNPAPDVPPPEELQSDHERAVENAHLIPEKYRAALLRPRPIEMRSVQPRSWFNAEPRAPVQQVWFKVSGTLPDDPVLHRAVLAYASDYALLGTSVLPHPVQMAQLQTASLDHALWLHEPMRADEWLLYSTDSPWAGHARGFNRGSIFARDGRLVASVTQEALIRVRR